MKMITPVLTVGPSCYLNIFTSRTLVYFLAHAQSVVAPLPLGLPLRKDKIPLKYLIVELNPSMYYSNM